MTLRKLNKAIAKLKPVTDARTKWLNHLRPSQAFLVCIGSGPWKYNRRFKVQAKALDRLGDLDLVKMRVTNVFPLEWQMDMLRRMIRYCKHHDIEFDELIQRGSSQNRKESAEHVTCGITHPKTPKPRPKVIGMFVRDYLKLDCFPIDRHVRKWLQDNHLPSKEDDVVALFHKAGKQARFYARAVFGEKSSNPVHRLDS